jgi:hypothetical protein
MTKWFHKCSLDWLKARQNYLTATDVKELLPVTKTGRKRTITDENYLKILANKMVNLTEDDCVSTGSAARGHILEPYAIDRYNEEYIGSRHWLYHWDDVVITRPNADPFSLAFSPDAMNVIMDYEIRRSNKRLFNEFDTAVTTIGEVKSYGPERHFVAGHTPKYDLEERWQIATAMAVCDSIEEACLLFYNPSMKDQLYIVGYNRRDLASEIDTVLDVEQNWLGWIDNLNKLGKHYTVEGKLDEEQAIIRDIMKREELNPEGEKSVIR